MVISFPTGTAQAFEEMVAAIGREVEFVQVTYSGCTYSGDSLDPITNTSTNSFCPVCSGMYWIPTFSGISILAHIIWKPSDVLQWESGGQYYTGDCLVKITYSAAHLSAAENAKYLVVDGKEMKVKNKTLLGVPQINRILLETVEKEKTHG